MRAYQGFLNVVATIIIAVTVIGVLILSFNYLTIPKSEIKTIKIVYTNVKSGKTDMSSEFTKIDSLLKDIKETSNKIERKQLELIENKSDDNFFNKLYTAVVAIILAIAGFFGFKSISEIKAQALEDAKIEATKIAKEESTRIAIEESREVAKNEIQVMFNADYEAQIFQKSTEAMSRLLREEVGKLEVRIFALEENIDEKLDDTIIDSVNNVSDENTENGSMRNEQKPQNPFEHE